MTDGCHEIDHARLTGYANAQRKNMQIILDLEEEVYKLKIEIAQLKGMPTE